MISRITALSFDHWQRVRAPHITASRVPALFGVHPYDTALRLYLEHSGVEFEPKQGGQLERGQIMEPAVAAVVARLKPEWRLSKSATEYRPITVDQFYAEYFFDELARLGATPDFFVLGDPRGLGVLQCKTAHPGVFERDWLPIASGEPYRAPFWTQLQNLTEQLLTGAQWGAVACLNTDPFNPECALVEVPRHRAAELKIRAAVNRFWHNVADGIEPDADYGKDADLIKLIAPREVADKLLDVTGDNELPAMLYLREELMDRIKRFTDRKDQIDTELKFRLRDHERMVGLEEWSVSYKTHTRAAQPAKPAKDQRTLHVHHRGSAA